MAIGTVFSNNRTQAVRLPAETRFPETVKRVQVRVLGLERVISPISSTWDSFFLDATMPTDDFMTQRENQSQTEREAL